MIVGIDEVGRGAWAGPLVVGAVLLGGVMIEGLTDSKKLTKKQREILDLEIRQKATGIGIGWVSAKDIDRIGLSEALKLASRRALAHIHHDYHEIIIDGTIALIDDPRVTLMKKADLLVPSVSAASIVAKVARDNYMRHLDRVFPGYQFTGHVGYGTAAHQRAIVKNGITPLHRLSFAPLQQYGYVARIKTPQTQGKTAKQQGDEAEEATSQYLQQKGHSVLARNWRTKWCEIDIVSRCDGILYFTEVKYRKQDNQGGGIAAITPKKLHQMTFAAELFMVNHRLDLQPRLAVADVSGQPPQVKTYLELS